MSEPVSRKCPLSRKSSGEIVRANFDVGVSQLGRFLAQTVVEDAEQGPDILVAHEREPAVDLVVVEHRDVEDLADPDRADAAAAIDHRDRADVALIKRLEGRIASLLRCALEYGRPDRLDFIAHGADDEGEERRDRTIGVTEAADPKGVDHRAQVVARISGIEILDVCAADIVPADVVERAGRFGAEAVGIERRLHEVLDRRIAGDAVIDDGKLVPAQHLLETIGPGVVVADGDVVGRRAAEDGDDRFPREFLGGVIAATRARAAMAGFLADDVDRDRRDRHALQQRMPFEPRIHVEVVGHDRIEGQTGFLHRQRPGAESQIAATGAATQGHSSQHGAHGASRRPIHGQLSRR